MFIYFVQKIMHRCIIVLKQNPLLSHWIVVLSTGWLILVGMCSLNGCADSTFGTYRGLPAPLRNDFPYEVLGQATSHIGGDSFQMNIDGTIHFVVIEGIDSPKPGQPFYDEAIAHLTAMVDHQPLRLHVIGRDSLEREVALVFAIVPPVANGSAPVADVPIPTEASQTIDRGSPESAREGETDVGLEMIQRGFSWFDRSDFGRAEQYRETEKAAREAARGLWLDPNPVSPWEFEGGQK